MGYVIAFLLIPGVLPAGATCWLIDRLRKVQPATGQLEEFVFFTMVWSAIAWLAAIGFVSYKLIS